MTFSTNQYDFICIFLNNLDQIFEKRRSCSPLSYSNGRMILGTSAETAGHSLPTDVIFTSFLFMGRIFEIFVFSAAKMSTPLLLSAKDNNWHSI